MVAAQTVFKIFVLILAIAVVVYLVFQFLIPPPYASFLPLRELTSLAGLACAVDVVGTQDPGVITCNKGYRWGSGNIFEEIVRGFSNVMSMGFFELSSYDVKCSQTSYNLKDKSSYSCISRVGHRVDVNCWKEGNQWICKVIGFDLFQNLPSEHSLLERLAQGVASFLTELAKAAFNKEIRKNLIPPNPVHWVWGLTLRDPEWLIFYETFPHEATVMYKPTFYENLLVVAYTGAITNAVIDVFQLAKSGVKEAVEKGFKELLKRGAKYSKKAAELESLPELIRRLAKGGSERLGNLWGKIQAKEFPEEALEFGEKKLHWTLRLFKKHAPKDLWKKLLLTWGLEEAAREIETKTVVKEAIERGTREYLKDAGAKIASDEFVEHFDQVYTACKIASYGGPQTSEGALKRIYDKIYSETLRKGEPLDWKDLRRIFKEELREWGVPKRIRKDFLNELAGEEGINKFFRKMNKEIKRSGFYEVVLKNAIWDDEHFRKAMKETIENLLTSRFIARLKKLREEAIQNIVKEGIITERSFKELIKHKLVPIEVDKDLKKFITELTDLSLGNFIERIKFYKFIDDTLQPTHKLADEVVDSYLRVYTNLEDAFKFSGFDVKTKTYAIANKLSTFLGFKSPIGKLDKKRLAAIAFLYYYETLGLLVQESELSKFETCGANSLCLWHHALLKRFPFSMYSIKLQKPNNIFVSVKVPEEIPIYTDVTFGAVKKVKNLRGVLLAPCKTDLIIKKEKISADFFVPSNFIAYRVPFVCGNVTYFDGYPIYQAVNLSSIDSLCLPGNSFIFYQKRMARPEVIDVNLTFFWENITQKGGQPIINTTGKARTIIIPLEKCEEYGASDFYECVKLDFLRRLENTDFSSIEFQRMEFMTCDPNCIDPEGCCEITDVVERGINILEGNTPENKKLIVRNSPLILLNLKRNILTGNLEIISFYDPATPSYYAIKNVESVVIEVNYTSACDYTYNSEGDYNGNYNYCLTGRVTTPAKSAWTILTFLPWDDIGAWVGGAIGSAVAPGLGTTAGALAGRVVGIAIDAVVGYYGEIEITEQIISMKWPRYQFEKTLCQPETELESELPGGAP